MTAIDADLAAVAALHIQIPAASWLHHLAYIPDLLRLQWQRTGKAELAYVDIEEGAHQGEPKHQAITLHYFHINNILFATDFGKDIGFIGELLSEDNSRDAASIRSQ